MDFVFATVVQVLDRVGGHSPFEGLDVTRRFTDLKHHVQHRPRAKETREPGSFVETIQFVEVTLESFVADQIQGCFVKLIVA